MAKRKRSKKKSGAGMPYSIAVAICAAIVAAQFFTSWANVSVMGSTLVELGPFDANDALMQIQSVPFVSAAVPDSISSEIRIWYISSIVSIVLVAAAAVLALAAKTPVKPVSFIAAVVPVALAIWFLIMISGYSDYGFVNTYAPVVIIATSVVGCVVAIAAPGK